MQLRPARPTPTRRAVAALAAGTLAAAGMIIFPGPAQAAAEQSITAIQGTGASSPLVGQTVSTEPSVITAVYPAAKGFAGFVIQAPGSGGSWDPEQPSSAVFVYAGSKMGTAPYDVQLGDAVTVTGKISEYQGLTEINATGVDPVEQSLPAPKPITGVRWQDTAAHRENLESMLLQPDQSFAVADTYPLYKYGELALGADGVPVQPTDVGAPDTPAYTDQLTANEANAVGLDDGTNQTFTATDDFAGGTLPYLTRDHDIRRGDQVTINEPVIVDYRNDSWKFNPTAPIAAGEEIATVEEQPKPAVPTVGNGLRVASFNVLNYFTSTGQGRDSCTGGNPDTSGSDNVTFDCDVRGAWDADDLGRQQAKIVAAINQLDPSVAGLMEIENSAQLGEQTDEAVSTLVDALNKAAHEDDKWAFVPSSKQLPDEADVITNALIYQPGKAELVTAPYADGADAGSGGAFANARTPIAAGFAPAGGGEPVLVSVNHFKSKGSAPDDGPNADQGDGQGAWNASRIEQAKALSSWISAVRKRTKIKSVALIGDFNSYSQEDPIRTLAAAGFANAAPADQYSYTFDGLAGSLDHVLLNKAARKRLDGAGVWGINSPEPLAAEYSTYRTTKIDYYRADPYRSSDHDPVLVGLAAGKRSSGRPH
ncbi:ExeM/NucH family extracellular endonuclease [Microlunatus soli]|uniref:Endonuclease/exonuclease/phosphatase domain-containing protein n=1 Tax=Microlunatus soli TaxID=630515 RepID=A0A1H1ZMC6_9ACTN|nr:ExeM/NucH family extracellular endonuclease [Microlunatus soli]SDT34830.1 hypothetical protein SAMN04489812_5318 [Microlunatus soli]